MGLRVDLQPVSSLRLSAQAFTRRSRGLAFVAPLTGEPFATAGGVAVGSSRASGVSASLAATGKRTAVSASYALQRVRHAVGGLQWTPQFGTEQSALGGITYLATPTFKVMIGAEGGWGRRSTSVIGDFEWESCNLRDRGCEFAGTPLASTDALGASLLPAYFRADVSVRKHWSVARGRRVTELALFGTISNIGNRRSALTRVIDPKTRVSSDVGMRPQAPLVVGVDWRF